MSDAKTGRNGKYREPSPELNFRNFVESLIAKAIAAARSE
jgi:hypothetical protein